MPAAPAAEMIGGDGAAVPLAGNAGTPLTAEAVGDTLRGALPVLLLQAAAPMVRKAMQESFVLDLSRDCARAGLWRPGAVFVELSFVIGDFPRMDSIGDFPKMDSNGKFERNWTLS